VVLENVTTRSVSLWQLFVVLGLTSFGGGLSGWMYRELVERRKWFSEEEFLGSLAIAQAMPGVNVINLSMWVAFRLRGSLGAVVGFCAMVFPPLCVIIPMSLAYAVLGKYALVHHALAGVAAAALAITLNMGQRVTTAASRDAVSILVVAATFVGVGILRFPMLDVVLAITPLSLGWSFYRKRRA